MATSIDVPAWIKRIADDERKRDAVRLQEQEVAARKAQIVRLNGQRLVDELLATVKRDVEAFAQEFPDDRSRDLVLTVAESGGFAVRKTAPPAVSLTVDLHLDVATVNCHYRFTSTRGLPPREERLELVFVGEGEAPLQMKQSGTGHVFANADDLSEFLLVPVVTGRPR